MKMDKLGEEVSDKIKSAVRAKLTELGIHIDNELPDYVMVLVANKKSQEQMEEDLRLFLGESTVSFTTWLYEILRKLERFTISSKGTKRKVDEKKSKHKKSSLESDNTSISKKVKLKNENTSFEKMTGYIDSEDISNSNEGFEVLTGRMDEKVQTDLQQPKLITYTDDEQMTAGDDDDTIQLHDNNEEGSISERPESSLGEKLLPDAKQLLGFTEKDDKYNGDKEDVKPRERIKISWDNNNAESKKKSDSKEDLNLANNQNNNENKEWEFNKMEISANFSTSVNEISSGDGEKSNVHEKSEYIGSKIMDARDILKKRSSLSSKVSKSESRTEKRSYSRRSSKDKGSKDNHSRRLSSVSKPVKRDQEKPTVPSLVKVTPRPVRPPGMQPSCNLILKAVADAEKSIASTKLIQKKVQNKNEPKEKEKEKKPETHRRSRRENISITLLNDRVISSDIEDMSSKQKDIEDYDAPHHASETEEDVKREATPISEIVENKLESTSPGSNGFQNLSSSTGELHPQLQEPRFIITLDSTASDTEMEGEIEISVPNEIREESSNNETLSVVRQPFDRSRLGPRLGPPVNDESGVTRDYRLFTIEEGNDSSQEVEMETSENGKSQTRCKYWPCCEAGSTCPYYHPTMLCRLFPVCHYGEKCLYIHPACKFADKCTNINCPYTHTSATPVVGKGTFKTPLPLSTPNGQVCIYYPHCTKPFCPYLHIKKPCKFGSSCTKLGCEYEHPNRTITKNPYKWVANQ